MSAPDIISYIVTTSLIGEGNRSIQSRKNPHRHSTIHW